MDVADDEQLQADYLRDVMIIGFSHPAMEATVMWGFWEGKHWKPAAALWRKDWSIKPAGQAWLDLVFKQWWTDETGRTTADGTCNIRGFLGEYEITADHAGATERATVVLSEGGPVVKLVLD